MTLDTHKFHFSREVIFHEDVFPLSTTSKDQSMFPLPPFFYDNTFDSPVLTPTSTVHLEEDAQALPTEQESTPQQVRRSTRGHRTPSYVNDYVCTAHTESHCMTTSPILISSHLA